MKIIYSCLVAGLLSSTSAMASNKFEEVDYELAQEDVTKINVGLHIKNIINAIGSEDKFFFKSLDEGEDLDEEEISIIIEAANKMTGFEKTFIKNGFKVLYPEMSKNVRNMFDKIKSTEEFEKVDYKLAQEDVTKINVGLHIKNIMNAIKAEDEFFFKSLDEGEDLDEEEISIIIEAANQMTGFEKKFIKNGFKALHPKMDKGAKAIFNGIK